MGLGDFLSSVKDQLTLNDGRTFSTRGKIDEKNRQFNRNEVSNAGRLLKVRQNKGLISKDTFNEGLSTAVANNARAINREVQTSYDSNEFAKVGSFLSGFDRTGQGRSDIFGSFNRTISRPLVQGAAQANLISVGGDISQLVTGGKYGRGLSDLRNAGAESSFTQADDNFGHSLLRATPGLAQDIVLALATGGGSAAAKGSLKGLSLAAKARKSSQLVRSGSRIVAAKHGATEAADQLGGVLDSGGSLTQAYGTALPAGLTQALITKYGMQNLLNPVGKGTIARLGARVLGEGVEEGSQELASNLFRKTYDPTTGAFDGVVESALIGAVLGGGVSSVDIARDLVRRGVPPVYAYQGAKDIEAKAQEAINDPKKLDKIVKEMNKDVEVKDNRKASFLQKFKAEYIDGVSPIEDTIAKLEKKTGTKVTDKFDATDGFDRSLRSGIIHGQFLRDSGFEQVIQDVPDIDIFDQYLIAKRAGEVEASGRKTGRDVQLDQQIIQQYGPEYEQHAQKIYAFTKQVREYMVESGTLSRELANQLESDNPLYVPLERDIDTNTRPVGGAKQVASLAKPTTVKKLVGSEKDIVSPIQSMLLNSADMIAQSERNKAATAIVNIAATPGFESLARPLEAGETSTGKNTISVYENGQKQVYEVDPEVESAAKSLDEEQLNTGARILAMGARVLRGGATGYNAGFAFSNPTKDAQTAFIFSREGIRSANPLEFARALKAVVTQDSLYSDAQRAGATGTLFQANRSNAVKSVQRLRSGKNIGSYTKHVVRNPKMLMDVVENVIGIGEQTTRVRQFNTIRKALLKKGMPLDQATKEASKSARRDTVDFFRKGSKMKTINATHAYLNANIQGSRQLVKAFRNRPVATSAKVVMSMYVPFLVAMAANYGDEEKKAIYDDLQDYEKENNIILVTGDGNDESPYDVIKIPLAPGISALMAPLRDFVENDPDGGRTFSASSVGQALVGATTPLPTGNPTQLLGAFTPDLIKPTAQQLTNKDFFTGEPIIKDYLKDLPVEEQKTKYTSGMATKLGGLLNVSPHRIDKFIKHTGAGVGNQFINATDNALAKAGVIENHEIGGESALSNLNRRFFKAQGGVQDDLRRTERQDLIDSLSPADQAAFDSLHTYNYENGEIVFQDKPLFSQEKAATYINSPQVFEVDRTLAFKDNEEKGKPVDPIFAVPDEIANAVLLSKIALPGESGDLKQQILYEQPWYDEWRAMQDKYYDAKAKFNQEQGYEQDPVENDGYPQASPELQQKLDYYYNLEAGTGDRSDFIRANPDVADHFDATKRFKNVQRAKLGLPPIDDSFSGNFGGSGGSSGSGGKKVNIRPSQFGSRISVGGTAPSGSNVRKVSVRGRKRKSGNNTNSLKLKVNRANV